MANELQGVNGQPFFQTLNVDWFQPYTHVCDSLGAIYLVDVNLPRSERYKWENMILVGLIPGPKEPKCTINSYFYPLVKELLQFWADGVQVIACDGTHKLLQIALSMCVL